LAAKHGQDEPVARPPCRSSDLPPEDADLVAQSKQLQVTRPIVLAADEDEVGEQADESVEDRRQQRRLQERGCGRLPNQLVAGSEYLHPTGA
jgi:hypothetical protein